MPDSVFISTSIPYVNGPPHVGFAWELVIADVLARYHRLRGADVFFLTGTDDNSLKNVRAAERAGAATDDFVRRQGDRFVALGAALGLSNDDLLRTAFDARHAPAVEKLWRACARAGDLELRPYRGSYCVGCEAFYAASELVDGRCPEHDEPLESVEEANHFFRLRSHEPRLRRALDDGALLLSPAVYRRDVERWFEVGLEDFSISRQRQRARGWGIEVPDDPSQTIYVWFDALATYISALDYAREGERFERYWRGSARRIHVIGKNLTRFHCVYWPAILASAGLPAPTEVVVHGFLTVGGRKIGKSLGNGVDPFELIAALGRERVRYYLSRQFPLGKDGDFSAQGAVLACNAELSDQLGNLLNRVLVLLEKYSGGVVPELAHRSPLAEAARRTAELASRALEGSAPDRALAEIAAYIAEQNLSISEREPWRTGSQLRLAPDAEARGRLGAELTTVLGDAARALLWTGALLEPFLPDTAARIGRALGAALPAVYAAPERVDWASLAARATIERGEVLFARVAP